jgi:transcriptional regulator of acetoin/glycerol metabolism
MALFRAHHWPGNFRQLHNLLRTAVVMVGSQGMIELIHLPDDFLEEQEQMPQGLPAPVQNAGPAPDSAPATPSDTDGQRLQDVALIAMTKMLQQHKGNVSAAAKALGVSRNTVYRRKEQLPPDVWN